MKKFLLTLSILLFSISSTFAQLGPSRGGSSGGSSVGANKALQMSDGVGGFLSANAATFATSLTGPLLYGGSGTGSTLTLQSTSNGSPSGDYIAFKVGGAEKARFTGAQLLFGETSDASSRIGFYTENTSGVPPYVYGLNSTYYTTATGGTGDTVAGVFFNSYSPTDGVHFVTQATGVIGKVQFGSNSVAPEGTGVAIESLVEILGSGHTSNEFSAYFGNIVAKFGTGYTRTSDPAGRYWLMDLGLVGPIELQPNLYNGIVLSMNNYYNGSPSSSASGGMWLTTQAAVAANGVDATHLAATTYPNGVGIGIVGTSGVANPGATRGWTTALQIGGAGGPWSVASSYIGTGINIRDTDTYGIYINNKYTGSTGWSIAVDSTASPVVIGGTTGNGGWLTVKSSNTDPTVEVGSSSSSTSTVRLYNASGISTWFMANSANQYLTGTAQGDAGMRVQTASKAYHIGGTSSIIKVTNANTLSFFNVTAVAQQTSAANLTNNVTSGGTDDTIANYTDLTTYATDAAAIRNNIYQLARKLKQVNDGLRSLGLFN